MIELFLRKGKNRKKVQMKARGVKAFMVPRRVTGSKVNKDVVFIKSGIRTIKDGRTEKKCVAQPLPGLMITDRK